MRKGLAMAVKAKRKLPVGGFARLAAVEIRRIPDPLEEPSRLQALIRARERADRFAEGIAESGLDLKVAITTRGRQYRVSVHQGVWLVLTARFKFWKGFHAYASHDRVKFAKRFWSEVGEKGFARWEEMAYRETALQQRIVGEYLLKIAELERKP
jgi:hypothetical protein